MPIEDDRCSCRYKFHKHCHKTLKLEDIFFSKNNINLQGDILHKRLYRGKPIALFKTGGKPVTDKLRSHF